MVIAENTIIIQTEEDFKKKSSQYGVDSIDALAELLWFDHGIVLIDDRKSSEYTQVNAQSSVDFFNEEMTESEMEEEVKRRSIYGTC